MADGLASSRAAPHRDHRDRVRFAIQLLSARRTACSAGALLLAMLVWIAIGLGVQPLRAAAVLTFLVLLGPSRRARRAEPGPGRGGDRWRSVRRRRLGADRVCDAHSGGLGTGDSRSSAFGCRRLRRSAGSGARLAASAARRDVTVALAPHVAVPCLESVVTELDRLEVVPKAYAIGFVGAVLAILVAAGIWFVTQPTPAPGVLWDIQLHLEAGVQGLSQSERAQLRDLDCPSSRSWAVGADRGGACAGPGERGLDCPAAACRVGACGGLRLSGAAEAGSCPGRAPARRMRRRSRA